MRQSTAVACALALSASASHTGEPLRFRPAVREGFAARSAFDLVLLPEGGVHAWAGDRMVSTFLLDPDKEARKVGPSLLGTWTHASLVAAEPPFVFDLVVHGDGAGMALLAERLDFRKFLHQSLAGTRAPDCLVRLQAYFAEFSRKAKVLHPRRDPTTLEAETIPALDALLSALAEDRLPPAASDAVRRAAAALGADGPVRIDVVESNLLQARAALAGGPHVPRLDAAADSLGRIAVARRFGRLRLVNNCREPGNYEVWVNDRLDHRLFRGNFTIPPSLYDELLRRYHGLGIAEQGSGVRVPPPLKAADPRAYEAWDAPPRDVPRCDVQSLAAIRMADAAKRTSGKLRVTAGRIPYEDHPVEARGKSAYGIEATEPLSYVRVDPALPAPPGFQSPTGGSPSAYWSAPENAGKVVPHVFAAYEDLRTYHVHLSGFEADGIYVGQSKLHGYDRERAEGRWSFDYRYLAGIHRVEAVGSPDGPLEIQLLGEGCPDSINFVLGNLVLAAGETREQPLGVAEQPLIADYDDDPFQDPPLYVLAYGGDGIVLDHHSSAIGVELAAVTRLSATSFRIRLLSHERIVAVWEGVVDLAAAPVIDKRGRPR